MCIITVKLRCPNKRKKARTYAVFDIRSYINFAQVPFKCLKFPSAISELQVLICSKNIKCRKYIKCLSNIANSRSQSASSECSVDINKEQLSRKNFGFGETKTSSVILCYLY